MSRLKEAVSSLMGKSRAYQDVYRVTMRVTVDVPASSREAAMAVAFSSFHTLRATVVSAQDAVMQD